MRVKSTIESILRICPPLYRFGSRFYHRMNPEFKTLSPGAPQAIKNAFDLIKTDPDASQFEGDYYEFGLFRGGTFLATSQILKGNGQNAVHLYGFDSFEGLPAAEDVDTIDTRFFEGQFACSREEVVKNLEQHGMDMARATLIEGYYEDSLTPQLHDQYPFKPASVVLLDCDYYTSTKTAMEWMTRYFQVGTVLLFDDWFSYGDNQELGQQKALEEWLQANPKFRVELLEDFEMHGRGFVLRRATNA